MSETKVRRNNDGTWQEWLTGNSKYGVPAQWQDIENDGHEAAFMEAAYQLATSESAARIKALEDELRTANQKADINYQIYLAEKKAFNTLLARITELEGAMVLVAKKKDMINGGWFCAECGFEWESANHAEDCDVGAVLAATAPVQEAGDARK